MTRKADILRHFKRVDPTFFNAVHPHVGNFQLVTVRRKTRDQLFASLAEIVIAQQLGTLAADTICKRVKAACGGRMTPESISRTPASTLRKAGASAAKVKTMKLLARAVQKKKIDLLSLQKAPEHEAVDNLLAIWGLGPWSVEMFLMFSLGREDVFSPGDLGLARAIEMIYGLPKNTPRTSLLELSKKWAPYRTYASILLWRMRDAALH